jgi:amino acid permease
MSSETAAKIYEWCSYILILGATLIFFFLKNEAQLRINLTLIVAMVAVYMRVMMYRSRNRDLQGENEDLRQDLRRLTAMLAEKEKKGIK